MDNYSFKVTVCLGHGDGGDIEVEVPLSKASVRKIRKHIKEKDGDYFFDDLEKDAPRLYNRIYSQLLKAAKDDVDSLNEDISGFSIMAELPDIFYKQEKFIKPLDPRRLTVDDIKIYIIEMSFFGRWIGNYAIIATTDEKRAIEKCVAFYNSQPQSRGAYSFFRVHKVLNANEAFMGHPFSSVPKTREALIEFQNLLAEWIRLVRISEESNLINFGIKHAESRSEWAAVLYDAIGNLKDGQEIIENPLPDCTVSDLKLCVARTCSGQSCWGLGLDKNTFQPIAEKVVDEYFVEKEEIKDINLIGIDEPTMYKQNHVVAHCATDLKDFFNFVTDPFTDRLFPSYNKYSKYTEIAEVAKKIRDVFDII